MTDNARIDRRSLTALVIGGVLASWFAATPAAASSAEMKPETLERMKKATVLVFTAMTQSTKGDTPFGSGSGYFINRTGLLITNNHVVDPTHRASDDAKRSFHYRAGRLVWTVVTNSGTDDEKTYECSMVYQNEWADQAILQAYVGRPEDGEMLQTPYFMPLMPESRLSVRMPVWTFGFPGGDRTSTQQGEHPEVSITTGHVLDVPRTPGGRIQVIYVDSLARPGNSGGPCVNIDGFVLGTLTIMASPEGREDTGGNTGAGLVPSTLTARFVRLAYDLGKIPSGSDPTPFMRALTNEDGRIDIPEYPRRANDDVVVFPNGDRVYGEIVTDEITWNSPLGTVEVPTDAIAYVMTDLEGAKLYLEGGNLIQAAEVGSTFKFKPMGGAETELNFDDLNVVCFRTKDRRVEPVLGEVVIFETDAANLTLAEVDTKVKFEGPAGVLEFPLDDIRRIQTREADGKRIVTLSNDMRMTGEFTDEPFNAVIAATGTPIKFSMAKVEEGVIESTYEGVSDVEGINLMALMLNGDRDVRRIARRLESNDFEDAWKRIKRLTADKKKFRNFSALKQEQVAILEAVAYLREGKYQEANTAFRQASRGEDGNIVAFANAFMTVLKEHPTGEVDGEPLSKRAVFAEAGVEIAAKIVAGVQNLLRDFRGIDDYRFYAEKGGLKKGQYRSTLPRIARYEKDLLVAGVLGGIDADQELIRLWKFGADLCQAEIYRLQQELQEEEEANANRAQTTRGGRGGGGRGGGIAARMDRLRQEIQNKMQEAAETAREFQIKLALAGFRIQDPDAEAQRDKSRSDDDEDEPGP